MPKRSTRDLSTEMTKLTKEICSDTFSKSNIHGILQQFTETTSVYEKVLKKKNLIGNELDWSTKDFVNSNDHSMYLFDSEMIKWESFET